MANGVLGKAPWGVIAIALCVVLTSSGCIGCRGEACINRVTFVSRTAAFVGPDLDGTVEACLGRFCEAVTVASGRCAPTGGVEGDDPVLDCGDDGQRIDLIIPDDEMPSAAARLTITTASGRVLVSEQIQEAATEIGGPTTPFCGPRCRTGDVMVDMPPT